MKVLITGGTGFLGYHLAAVLAADAEQIVLADDLSRGRLDRFVEQLIRTHRQLSLVEVDLTVRENWDQLGGGYDQVFHLAAVNGTAAFYRVPFDVLSRNIAMSMHCIDWLRSRSPTARVLFASSNEAYAGALEAFGKLPLPTPETVPLLVPHADNPRWSYGGSKLAGEQMFRYAHLQFGLQTTIVRPHNIYGPRAGWSHVIPEGFTRIRARQEPFPIWGADQTRAFCYVTDAVRAMRLLLQTPMAVGAVYHVGSPDEIFIGDLFDQMFHIAGWRPDKVRYLSAPEGSAQRRVPDVNKISAEVGWVATTGLSEGLCATFSYYDRNEEISG